MSGASTDGRLDADEAAALLRRYAERGDIGARNRVVEAHLPLARHIVGDYLDKGVDRDDLVQVATIGLLKASDRFDADRGVPFAAYASQVMNGEIKRWFRDRGWSVRPPRTLIELGTRLRRVRAELSQQLQRAPTVAELAEALDVDESQVLDTLESLSAYRSDRLVRSSPDGGEEETVAVPEDDEELRRAELREAVAVALETLTEQEQQIVRRRFWDEWSQQAIADEVGVSQMQVSRVLRRVLRRLRDTGGFEDA